MLILGIETSCDETGLALLDSEHGLLAQRLHSQVDMHVAYGGVVPELASRDHIRRVLPLLDHVLEAGQRDIVQIDAIAVTAGPGLAGALLVGSSIGHALGYALQRPVYPVHHMEGHLLSPLLSSPAPQFPFVALLVSGGHTQLLHVGGWGRYRLLGETLDDAAGEAFDKTAQVLGLGYPGGPAVSRLAEFGNPGAIKLPRPMLDSDDMNFSFSGLKTAVLTTVRRAGTGVCDQERADIARGFVEAIVDVLAAKTMRALDQTGLNTLVVAGGVGANAQLRERLQLRMSARGGQVFFPPLDLCTDNGAMIALAGLAKLRRVRKNSSATPELGFSVHPRWSIAEATR
ncbi:MAG TPA: tRNA (adenosine(37)-N6)-threonylcarbamoyltransferase complex transferase subunit TsaD [Burkholderiaceae bacterium]|nr:tRNA (adenosine(37)-N6)-threonylcarbamoyltransferase complex transferase subunit TsaD [Burkholderiaceae bacterium]